jgi:hypothetical protein
MRAVVDVFAPFTQLSHDRSGPIYLKPTLQ